MGGLFIEIPLALLLYPIPLEMRDMTPYGYRIVTDAGAWEGEALLLVAANTRYFGGGLDIAYRVDKQAAIHLGVGKVSFGAEKLLENANTFFASLQAQKPSSIKGVYIKSVAVATTMGPGIKVDYQAK